MTTNLEVLASQATCRSAAAEQVRIAEEDVLRIKTIGTEVVTAEREVAALAAKITEAEQALTLARGRQAAAETALKAAEEAAHAEESDPGVSDMVVRQQLELRTTAAVKRADDDLQRCDLLERALDVLSADQSPFGKPYPVAKSRWCLGRTWQRCRCP